jgi:hypothetical protein
MKQARTVPLSFLALIAVAAVVTPAPALAQAWLAPRGEASFSLGYMNMWVNDHVFNDGVPFDGGRIDTQAVSSSLGYAVTDRFSLSVGLPFVAARYQGDQPHARNGVVTLDNGNYHGTFQDFRIEARYMATTGSLVVTPFVGVGLPSHSYEYFAHTAPGKDIKEVQGGVSIGRRLDPVLADAYFQGRYAYSVPERVLGISHNRSNFDLELGYFVTPALTVRALSFVQVSHGGFHEPYDIVTPVDFEHHDQVARTNFFELGFGAAYALTRSLDGYASWLKTISARNTHLIAGALSVGLSVNFSPAQMIRNRKRAPAPSS